MPAPSLSLQEISDRLEIQDLLTRYTVAIDTKDWKLLDTCFAPEAYVDYTCTGGVKGPYPEVRKWLEEALAPFAVTSHYISNCTVKVAGDTATAHAYLHNPMGLQNPDGSQHWFTVGAQYLDDLVRMADGWRIKRRVQQRGFFQGALPGADRAS
jgi:3-phenylpropionate/cinnamic acid dioxygenase small subunit